MDPKFKKIIDLKRREARTFGFDKIRIYPSDLKGWGWVEIMRDEFPHPIKARLKFYKSDHRDFILAKHKSGGYLYNFSAPKEDFWLDTLDLTQPWELLSKRELYERREKPKRLTKEELEFVDQTVLSWVKSYNRSGMRADRAEYYSTPNAAWFIHLRDYEDIRFPKPRSEAAERLMDDRYSDITKRWRSVFSSSLNRLNKKGLIETIYTTSPRDKEVIGYYDPDIYK